MSKNSHTNCPVAKTALLLSDVWTMLVVRDLLGGKMRFSEIEASLKGVSSRTLSLKLKRLEDEKIIIKNDLHYTLSSKGKRLKKVIDAMESWGKSL